MTGHLNVSDAFDGRLDALPSVPPEHYLAAGRAAHRRRRLRHGGGVIGLAVAGILVTTQMLSQGAGSEGVREHRPETAASVGTIEPRSLSNLPVRAGIGAIDGYSTDDVPPWAKEYGNNGPAAIAPDGRLWVAPDTEVVRSIADPFGVEGSAAGVAHSYALEVRWHPSGDEFEQGSQGESVVAWWLGYQDQDSTATLGSMDDPNRWTSDFALWAQNEAANLSGKPQFIDQLVRFKDDRSDVLVPLSGVRILQQQADVDTGDMQQYARRSAAEVVVDGQTYFVLANGPRVGGRPFYEPYQAGLVAPDLAGFLDFVASGFVSRTPAP